MNLPTKVILLQMFFLMSIVQINYAHNLMDTNNLISFTSEKEASVSFYEAYNSNWTNIENHKEGQLWYRMVFATIDTLKSDLDDKKNYIAANGYSSEPKNKITVKGSKSFGNSEVCSPETSLTITQGTSYGISRFTINNSGVPSFCLAVGVDSPRANQIYNTTLSPDSEISFDNALYTKAEVRELVQRTVALITHSDYAPAKLPDPLTHNFYRSIQYVIWHWTNNVNIDNRASWVANDGNTYNASHIKDWILDGTLSAADVFWMVPANNSTQPEVLLNQTSRPAPIVTDIEICSDDTYQWSVNDITYKGSEGNKTVIVAGSSSVNSQGAATCSANQILNITVTQKQISENLTSSSAIDEDETKILEGNPTGGTFTIVSGGGTISNNDTYTPDNINTNTDVTIRYTIAADGGCAETSSDVTFTVTTVSGSIGDTVWFDTDGDGIKDAGENGLQGATVTLDPGTPGNLADDITAITDVNGNYLFDNLQVAVYTVTVDVSTVTSGLPAGVAIADLIPTFDEDGVGTANTSTLSLPSGTDNLDQDFAYGISSGGTSGGNAGGVESESLGDAISKIYVGRKKNSVPTEFVKSSENVYNKAKLKSSQPYQGKGQTMLDMFPTQLSAGNIANVTSPTDILDYTVADEVLSVDFSVDGQTKGVVLGIKTSDKIYNHTKASCDRLRGAEILNIQTIEIGGYNFLMQGIKQRNGVVEYAVSFATAKNNNDAKYTIQTNWYVNAYTKFNDVYNFQVWSTRPADTQKLVADILENLNSFIPVQQPEIQKFPKTYASKIYREKGELVVALRSTEVGKTADISMVELYSETANNIKFRDNSLSTEIQQSLRLDIADGYEYDALVKVNNEVEDAFYHADGNWGLDYDKRYTEVLNYFVWNNFDREYGDDEYVINRDVELKATSEYDYLTVYKSLLPGTISADYSEYKYVAFTAKGSGLMELGLIKSSIEDWKAQYRVMVDFSEEERTYYVPFDVFTSSANQENMTAEDLTTLTFTFLPVEAQTKELDLNISNVRFTKTAVESQTIQKIEKFENEFMAYPNPSKGNVNLLLFSETDTEASVTLSDITGKVIYRGKAQLNAGKNELEFDFKVKTGVMLLQVNSAAVNYGTSKIIFR